MSKSCTVMAHVINAKGEIVESKLFNDLLHYTSDNRELSKEYYKVGTSEEFLSQVRDSDDFQVDENGEITLQSLRTLSEMDIETDKLVQVLNKDIGEGEYSYNDAIMRVQKFNENHVFADQMLATMTSIGNGRYYVSVVPKIKTVTDSKGNKQKISNEADERQKLHKAVRDKELENRIKELLRRHKVSVKFLEGEEKGGRYSTENAVKMEDGLYGLIEANENGYTSEVLAEEAGHFAVGALGDNPLVQRLEGLLQNPEVQSEALGELEFDKTNLGDNPAREVAGKLVGKALQRKLENNSAIKVLANRIANLAKRVFYNITGDQVRWLAAKAEQTANRIAYQFVEGDNSFSLENALRTKETRYSDDSTKNQQLYENVMDEMGRMVKTLEAIAQDQFTGQAMASQAMAAFSGINGITGESALQMDAKSMKLMADSLSFDGIVQAIVQVTDFLGDGKQIDRLITSVEEALKNPSEFYPNMARNGKMLRQARSFLRSATVIIDLVDTAVRQNQLTLPNGSTLTDIKYQDEKGNWRSINLKAVLSVYTGIAASDSRRLESVEKNYFARFCEDIYGGKYITTTVGKVWGNMESDSSLDEETISIQDLIEGTGMDDIDIFHRYIGSMSNNPDIIGQLVDKLVKSANKTADDQTRKFQDRLIIMKDRAKKLGLDIEDLIEKDENGIPTGNIITPPAYRTAEGNAEEDFIYEAYEDEASKAGLSRIPAVEYGRWEEDREKHKKEHWEKFKEKHKNWKNMSGFARGYAWDEYYRDEYKKFNEQHSIKVEIKDPSTGEVLYVKWVPNLTYSTDRWEELRLKYKPTADDSLDKWMYDFMEMKKELDSKLPLGSTVSYRLPQFRGTFMNTVRNNAPLEKGEHKKLKSWMKTFGRRGILESFVETADDTDYGDMRTMNSSKDELMGTKLNYEMERASRLPIFGVNKLKDMRDLSTDVFHSMLAYASMANSYACLENVVDALEVGAEALYNRDIKGKKTLAESGLYKIGSMFRKKSGPHEARFNAEKNRAFARYLKFLDKQVYGISAECWGFTFKNGKRVILSKVIKNITSLGGTIFLKGNLLGGTVNTLTGFNNIFKEAMTADYFDAKDWIYAHGYYWKNCPNMWMQAGQLKKNDKLSLFLNEMNALGNNREKFRSWHTNRNVANNFYRALGYLPYSSGDHYMQAMSYLSVAHGTKLYNPLDGKGESNLWDAYRVIDSKDEFGHYTAGKTLEFSKFCPINAKDITSKVLKSEGVYIRPTQKSNSEFEDWLKWNHPEFIDEVYKNDHKDDYNTYKEQYYNLKESDIAKYKAEKYNMLTSILDKVESYSSASGLLNNVPVFNNEELTYLSSKKIGNGDYSNILQAVRDDIYGLIWTKADESAYMDKCREINNRLHGIYNEQDKTAWHQSWYTNAFLAMKGWALGYLESMYSNNHYSIALGRNTEGFVNTSFKMLASAVLGMFGGSNSLSMLDLLISMGNPWSPRAMKAMKKAGFSVEQNMNARRMAISMILMGMLWALRVMTAGGDDDDDEVNPFIAMVYYMSMRTLIEQEAFLYAAEIYNQTGQLMDFLPVGFSAVFDLGTLGVEGVGALFADKTNSDYFYQRDSKDGRHLQYDSHFWHHFLRLIPYVKSWWGLWHGYEAAKNYNYGRKLRSR